MNKHLRITMPDGSKWDVPVMAIARNRATFYAQEFGNDVERSLTEDTLPLFAEDEFEIRDWAANNMDWDDVADQAVLAVPSKLSERDKQRGWMNGAKEFVSR